jgi:hypothetical protein
LIIAALKKVNVSETNKYSVSAKSASY